MKKTYILFLLFTFFYSIESNGAVNMSSNQTFAETASYTVLKDDVLVINSDIKVKNIVINGIMRCRNNSADNFTIQAESIVVKEGGQFVCGHSASNRFPGKLNIQLKANYGLLGGTSEGLFRGFVVEGLLKLHGNVKKKVSYLKNNSGAKTNKLYFKEKSDWNVGDELAIAPSSYNYKENEKFKIISIDRSHSTWETITLSGNLKYPHRGMMNPERYQIPGKKAFFLNTSAEVVNLSRDIKIQGLNENGELLFSDVESKSFNKELGAHLMIHNNGVAKIDSVEFFHMGRAGKLARYPIHWHHHQDHDEMSDMNMMSDLKDASGQYIKNSSIHDSFQRCVVVHNTMNVVIENNVCARFKGHGYFLESGKEVQNTIIGNIGIGAYPPFPVKALLQSDISGVGTPKRFPAVSVFWISNPQNTINNNIAAGCEGTGFWNAFKMTQENLLNTLSFEGNIAHGCKVGMTWDGAPTNTIVANPNNPDDRKLDMSNYSPTEIPVFKNLVNFMNYQTGIYFRGKTAVFENNIFAENGWNAFFAFHQILKDSAIIARSNKYTNRDESRLTNVFNDKPTSDTDGIDFKLVYNKKVGVVIYDGPFEVINTDFFNFSSEKQEMSLTKNGVTSVYDVTDVPFGAIFGDAKLQNRVSGLSFSNTPYKYIDAARAIELEDDEKLSQVIRDSDGSLGGVVGGIITNDSDFLDVGCVRRDGFNGFMICPSGTNLGMVRVTSLEKQGDTKHKKKIFQMQRKSFSDNSISIKSFPDSEFKFKRFLKTAIPTSTIDSEEDFYYSLKFLQKHKRVIIDYIVESGATRRSPIIEIIGLGSNCSMRLTSEIGNKYHKWYPSPQDSEYGTNGKSILQRHSLEGLRKASRQSFFYNENTDQFFVKLGAVDDYSQIAVDHEEFTGGQNKHKRNFYLLDCLE